MDDSLRTARLEGKYRADSLEEVTAEGVIMEEVNCTKRPRIEEQGQSKNSNSSSSVSDFTAVMKYYMTDLQSLGPAALNCVACDELPDDPYVAQCGHLFCAECHSEILYKEIEGDKTNKSLVPCTVSTCHGDIVDALALDPGQWSTLAEIQGLSSQQRNKWNGQVGSIAVSRILPDQQSGPDGLAAPMNSPSLSLDSSQEVMSENDSIHQDSSDDGYSDLGNRSVDYATESGTDDGDLSELGEPESDADIDTSSIGDRVVADEEIADLLKIHLDAPEAPQSSENDPSGNTRRTIEGT